MAMIQTISSVIHHKISWISEASLNSLVDQISSAAQPKAAHTHLTYLLRKHAGMLLHAGQEVMTSQEWAKPQKAIVLSYCLLVSICLKLTAYFAFIF